MMTKVELETFVEGTTHYVPMERPDEVAALVLEQISA